MAGYVICTEPRSGSNYLAQLLTSTNVLGRPQEVFNTQTMRRTHPAYPDDAEAQLALVPTLGATPNGVYALKMFGWLFDLAKGVRWAERLPNLSFVFLQRADLLGQAISDVRANQTQQWTHVRPAVGEPSYSAEAINHCLVNFARAQARWRYYFSRNGIESLDLVYEDVVRSPQAAVEAVGRLIGLDESPTIDFDRVDLKIQRDTVTEEWRARFIAESRDLAAFH